MASGPLISLGSSMQFVCLKRAGPSVPIIHLATDFFSSFLLLLLSKPSTIKRGSSGLWGAADFINFRKTFTDAGISYNNFWRYDECGQRYESLTPYPGPTITIGYSLSLSNGVVIENHSNPINKKSNSQAARYNRNVINCPELYPSDTPLNLLLELNHNKFDHLSLRLV